MPPLCEDDYFNNTKIILIQNHGQRPIVHPGIHCDVTRRIAWRKEVPLIDILDLLWCHMPTCHFAVVLLYQKKLHAAEIIIVFLL